MSKKYEVRSFGGEAAPKLDGRTIDGYAVVFNQRSQVMYDWAGDRYFREIISPSAITEALVNTSDVRALVEHDRYRLLARSNKGKGTLSLDIDDHGLRYVFDAPKTADGDYVVEMVSRGDISGSSFAFSAKRGEDDVWKKGDDGIWERTINKIRYLADVTVTSDPAYTQTEVSVRSIEELEIAQDPEPDPIDPPTPPAEKRGNLKTKIQLLNLKINS